MIVVRYIAKVSYLTKQEKLHSFCLQEISCCSARRYTMNQEANAWEDRIALVRKHYEEKGYRVHSGLQFGVELVLYAGKNSNSK